MSWSSRLRLSETPLQIFDTEYGGKKFLVGLCRGEVPASIRDGGLPAAGSVHKIDSVVVDLKERMLALFPKASARMMLFTEGTKAGASVREAFDEKPDGAMILIAVPNQETEAIILKELNLEPDPALS